MRQQSKKNVFHFFMNLDLVKINGKGTKIAQFWGGKKRIFFMA